MRQFGRSRSQPAAWTPAWDLFERARSRYFRIQPGVRPLAVLVILVLAVAVAVVGGQPVLSVVISAVLLLVVVDLTLRSPVRMAAATVVVCWLALCIPLGRLFPTPQYQAVGLAALALPVAFAAFR
ncbi:MAG TPA: ATPase, partial [Streptosporangiaceae bacterium]|nr:ATPase [Streptosporangiaceae bacterium]